MRIRRTMTRDVIWVTPKDALPDVYDLMNKFSIRHFPVLDGNRLVGILSRGDILLQAVADAKKAFIPDLLVADAMTKNPFTCEESDDVGKIASVMIDNKIDCLPVMRADRLVGMVTSTDFLRLLAQKETVKVRSLFPKGQMIRGLREIYHTTPHPVRGSMAF